MGWLSKMFNPLGEGARGLLEADEAARQQAAQAAEAARVEAERVRQEEIKTNAGTVAASRGGRASQILTGGRGVAGAPNMAKPSQTLAGLPADPTAPPAPSLGDEDEATKRLKMR